MNGLRERVAEILGARDLNMAQWNRNVEDLIGDDEWADRILALLEGDEQPVAWAPAAVEFTEEGDKPLGVDGMLLNPDGTLIVHPTLEHAAGWVESDGFEVIPLYAGPSSTQEVERREELDDELYGILGRGALSLSLMDDGLVGVFNVSGNLVAKEDTVIEALRNREEVG
ncbi:MAG: hypothetical protein AAF389_14735 [Gemmatimonadota bacterium]